MFFTSGLVSVPGLLSLSSGVMASEEVDCYKAYKVGSILLSKYQRYMKYSEVKFKKSGCIKNMILTHCCENLVLCTFRIVEYLNNIIHFWLLNFLESKNFAFPKEG